MPADWDLFTDGDLPGWFVQAACRDVDTDVFFPDKGATTTAAVKICQGCPVQAVCLQWALDTGADHGVWGGTSPQERAGLREQVA